MKLSIHSFLSCKQKVNFRHTSVKCRKGKLLFLSQLWFHIPNKEC